MGRPWPRHWTVGPARLEHAPLPVVASAPTPSPANSGAASLRPRPDPGSGTKAILQDAMQAREAGETTPRIGCPGRRRSRSSAKLLEGAGHPGGGNLDFRGRIRAASQTHLGNTLSDVGRQPLERVRDAATPGHWIMETAGADPASRHQEEIGRAVTKIFDPLEMDALFAAEHTVAFAVRISGSDLLA